MVAAEEPEWRQEIAHKLDTYRKRRCGVASLAEDKCQPALPFIPPPNDAPIHEHVREIAQPLIRAERIGHHLSSHVPLQAAEQSSSRDIPIVAPVRLQTESMAQSEAPARMEKSASTARPDSNDRMEISVSQSSLDFTLPDQRIHPESRLAPVSAMSERIQSGLIDIFFLVVVYAGFLLFFRTLGGHMDLSKTDAGIFTASFLMLYASYFSLFTIFGAATPGMLLTGLAVVQIDGALPEPSALAWRSIGYILSGGTVLLGFLWAIWDEDHLTWHDRISQTYITNLSGSGENELIQADSGDPLGFSPIVRRHGNTG
jgi:uncharacterized RDD family membrane protein YckC